MCSSMTKKREHQQKRKEESIRGGRLEFIFKDQHFLLIGAKLNEEFVYIELFKLKKNEIKNNNSNKTADLDILLDFESCVIICVDFSLHLASISSYSCCKVSTT